MAVEGRAKIEQQKQTALANIQKNREAALTALTKIWDFQLLTLLSINVEIVLLLP